MTIKEFYNWAVEKGIENYYMVNDFYTDEVEYKIDWWIIDNEDKEVHTTFEY